MITAGSSPVARPLARAATARDAARLAAHADAARFGWQVAYDGDVRVTVVLPARAAARGPAAPAAPAAGTDLYTLTLDCDAYDGWPPEVKFVNPATGTYVVGEDGRHLPQIVGFPNFGLHPRFQGFHDRARVDQLVCFSLTRGYYDSAHVPDPHQRWTPGRHWLYSTVKVLHRALQPPYYAGRGLP